MVRRPSPRRWYPGRTVALIAVLMGLGSGCAVVAGDDGPADRSTATVATGPPASGVTSAADQSADTTTAGPAPWCDGLEARSGGTVANPGLTELSGLAASQTHDGVLWAHNDSGHETIVFALGADGTDRGQFPLVGVAGVDIEDMALADGTIYLADIGDNDEVRDEVSVYRFTEPDPAAPGPVATVEELRFRYPDGPHDAESLLVDPTTGELAIIDKAFQFASGDSGRLLAPAPATVYTASPPFTAGEVTELVAAGTVALDELDSRATATAADGTASQLGLGGLATGADARADGRAIAVRTYATVWIFDRPAGSTLAQALAGTPCEAPTRPEAQGEAVAFLGGAAGGLVTVGEGVGSEVNLITAP